MSKEPVMIYGSLVQHLGGQTKTAKALDVSQPSVNAWIKGGAKMSILVAMRAERVTKGKYKAIELCPALKAEVDQATA